VRIPANPFRGFRLPLSFLGRLGAPRRLAVAGRNLGGVEVIFVNGSPDGTATGAEKIADK